MPIIDQLPPEQASIRLSRRFRSEVASLADQMEVAYETALRAVFKNPNQTPQQVCDALGTDCAELFGFLNDCKKVVQDYTGRTLTPISTYGSVTLNPDGTVTVNSVV